MFHIKVPNKYSGEDFDEGLRQVLHRSGCKDEKICFIPNKSNVMDSGSLERINTLLANGEGKEGAQRQGSMFNTKEKRSGLDEEEPHIHGGLDKIAKTVKQGEEMQMSMADKSTELEIKNKDINTKKDEVMKDLERV